MDIYLKEIEKIGVYKHCVLLLPSSASVKKYLQIKQKYVIPSSHRYPFILHSKNCYNFVMMNNDTINLNT